MKNTKKMRPEFQVPQKKVSQHLQVAGSAMLSKLHNIALYIKVSVTKDDLLISRGGKSGVTAVRSKTAKWNQNEEQTDLNNIK